MINSSPEMMNLCCTLGTRKRLANTILKVTVLIGNVLSIDSISPLEADSENRTAILLPGRELARAPERLQKTQK